MDISLTEQRQIENEMIFRRLNEKVDDELDDLNAMHIEDENPHLVDDDDLLLHFRCECSDEKCSTRLPIKLSVYRKIHENRNAFVIKLKHQVKSIENEILTEKNYSVVEKNNSTAEPGDTLNDTSIKE